MIALSLCLLLLAHTLKKSEIKYLHANAFLNMEALPRVIYAYLESYVAML